MICISTLQLFRIPSVTQSKVFWSSLSPSSQKDFPFVYTDVFLWNGAPVLNGFVENSCRGVHSHSNGDKTSFHLEINIMMTLKLVMKHICKKEVRGGLDGVSGRKGCLHRSRGDHKELRAFLTRESRCKGQTAPQ